MREEGTRRKKVEELSSEENTMRNKQTKKNVMGHDLMMKFVGKYVFLSVKFAGSRQKGRRGRGRVDKGRRREDDGDNCGKGMRRQEEGNKRQKININRQHEEKKNKDSDDDVVLKSK